MTTVNDILTDALVDSGAFGVGMAPPADAINKALRQLNWLIGQWNRKRWLIYQLAEYKVTATGAQTYQLGPSGQFVSVDNGALPVGRPDKINAAFMRQVNASPNLPVDYPLRVTEAYEDYARISLKGLQTWTRLLFYNSGLPNGLVYPWPIQSAPFEYHVIIKQQLLSYSTLNGDLGLPDEYAYAIYAVMKYRLRKNYRLPTDPQDVLDFKEALCVIRGANTAIASMKFPRAIRCNRNKYNIYSDDN